MKKMFWLVTTAVCMLGLAAAAEAQPATSSAPQVLYVTASGGTFQGKAAKIQIPKEIVIKAAGKSVRLAALGSGIRKKLVFRVYEGIAYADAEADLGTDPFTALIQGDFAKRIVMHFVRDVDGGKIRGAFQDGFDKAVPAKKRSPELAEDIERFLGYFSDGGVKKGQTIDLTWMPGMGLYTVYAGKPLPPIDDAALASALWAIWFGDKPVNGGLKRDMVRFVTKAE